MADKNEIDDRALLVQRFKFLNAVQAIAAADVAQCIEAVGLDALKGVIAANTVAGLAQRRSRNFNVTARHGLSPVAAVTRVVARSPERAQAHPVQPSPKLPAPSSPPRFPVRRDNTAEASLRQVEHNVMQRPPVPPPSSPQFEVDELSQDKIAREEPCKVPSTHNPADRKHDAQRRSKSELDAIRKLALLLEAADQAKQQRADAAHTPHVTLAEIGVQLSDRMAPREDAAIQSFVAELATQGTETSPYRAVAHIAVEAHEDVHRETKATSTVGPREAIPNPVRTVEPASHDFSPPLCSPAKLNSVLVGPFESSSREIGVVTAPNGEGNALGFEAVATDGRGGVDSILVSLNQMLHDGDAIATRHLEHPAGNISAPNSPVTFDNAVVRPKPESRAEPLRRHRPRYKRGSVPPEMLESILTSRDGIVDANKFNEGLWNLSGIPMSLFSVRFSEFLLVELVHDVQDEIGKVIDDAVDDVVNFEVGPPP